jgi:hypothetical protein
MRVATGILEQFRCEACGRAFTHVTFVGDSDVVTDGLYCSSSRETSDVAIIEAAPREDVASVERRIAETLERDDFVVLNSRYEGGLPPTSLSFADFRRVYRPPAHILSSPCCVGAEAREGGKASSGGVFTIGALRFRATD